jgi:ABC-type Fe3+ transport system permease subunit
MKGLLRIFELSKNEQRVVLIVILILLTIGFVGYERRIHPQSQQTSAMQPKPSPRAVETQGDD